MRFVILVSLIVLGALGLWVIMIRMPGDSLQGNLPPLSARETALKGELESHVRKLADEIGERNVARYDALLRAGTYIEGDLTAAGYEVSRQEFEVVSAGGAARTCWNLEVEIPGASLPKEIVIVGAHYDSAQGTPGADDNATGTAAVLALARAWRGRAARRTLRFVLFTNEEPPYFQTPSMGSLVYARRSRTRGENITAMLSLETIGYFSDAPGSQDYPFPINLFYPSTGNFIGFVGNISSRGLVHRTIRTFRASATLPSVGAALPALIKGVGESDQWSFWQQGYPGIMITDTAPFRNWNYHTGNDTPKTIKYDRLARVVAGLDRAIEELVSAE